MARERNEISDADVVDLELYRRKKNGKYRTLVLRDKRREKIQYQQGGVKNPLSRESNKKAA